MNKRDFKTSGIGAKQINITNAEMSIFTELKTVSFTPLKEKDSELYSRIKMNIILEIQVNLNGVIFDKSEKRLVQIIEKEEYNQLMKTL